MQTYTLDILWNDGHDVSLTDIRSNSEVLKTLFTLEHWAEVHDMSKAVATHKSFYGQNSGFSFVSQGAIQLVKIQTNSDDIFVDERFFIEKSLYLFELLIAGANEHHHTIRYETWWHAFTNYMFQIQEQIAS